MTQTYTIEKKTPSSNWYTIHIGIDNPAEILAEIAFEYQSMINSSETKNDLEADLQAQLDEQGYAIICVCDYTEDGNEGDYIEYRAVA